MQHLGQVPELQDRAAPPSTAAPGARSTAGAARRPAAADTGRSSRDAHRARGANSPAPEPARARARARVDEAGEVRRRARGRAGDRPRARAPRCGARPAPHGYPRCPSRASGTGWTRPPETPGTVASRSWSATFRAALVLDQAQCGFASGPAHRAELSSADRAGPPWRGPRRVHAPSGQRRGLGHEGRPDFSLRATRAPRRASAPPGRARPRADAPTPRSRSGVRAEIRTPTGVRIPVETMSRRRPHRRGPGAPPAGQPDRPVQLLHQLGGGERPLLGPEVSEHAPQRWRCPGRVPAGVRHPRPLLPRAQPDGRLGHRERGRVGGGVGAAHLPEDRGHLGRARQRVVLKSELPRELLRRCARGGGGHEEQVALVDTGEKLAAPAPAAGGHRRRSARAGDGQRPPRPAEGELDEGPVKPDQPGGQRVGELGDHRRAEQTVAERGPQRQRDQGGRGDDQGLARRERAEQATGLASEPEHGEEAQGGDEQRGEDGRSEHPRRLEQRGAPLPVGSRRQEPLQPPVTGLQRHHLCVHRHAQGDSDSADAHQGRRDAEDAHARRRSGAPPPEASAAARPRPVARGGRGGPPRPAPPSPRAAPGRRSAGSGR